MNDVLVPVQELIAKLQKRISDLEKMNLGLAMENCNQYPEDELVKLMRVLDINQTNLAVKLKISKGRMSEIINGKARLPMRGIRLAIELGADARIMLKPFCCEIVNEAEKGFK